MSFQWTCPTPPRARRKVGPSWPARGKLLPPSLARTGTLLAKGITACTLPVPCSCVGTHTQIDVQRCCCLNTRCLHVAHKLQPGWQCQGYFQCWLGTLHYQCVKTMFLWYPLQSARHSVGYGWGRCTSNCPSRPSTKLHRSCRARGRNSRRERPWASRPPPLPTARTMAKQRKPMGRNGKLNRRGLEPKYLLYSAQAV